MKIELEHEDILKIAEMVTEKLRPLIVNNGNRKTEDEILTKKELAEYLDVPVTWIDRKVSYNEIPYIKIGKYVRFKKSAIDRWTDKKTVKAIPR